MLHSKFTDRLLVQEKKILWFTIYGNDAHLGQGQPKIIIYTNFEEIEPLMLHAKVQDYRTLGPVEELFLPYMGMAAILVM